MNCIICSHEAMPKSKYCSRCQKYIRRHPKAIRRDALKSVWSKELDAFLCYYTGLKLEETDVKNPFHLVFDHRTPGDAKTLMPVTAFANKIKNALTEAEFRRFVPMLADRLDTGKPFDKDAFGLNHYKPARARKEPLAPKAEPLRIWSSEVCLVCGKEPVKNGLYCARCGKILDLQRWNEYRVEALIKAYDKEADGFRCRYTGLDVDLDDPQSPWHISFDHRFPTRDGNLVVAVKLVNTMKDQLSEDEFIIIIKNLAKRFRTGEPFDLGGVKFEYWGDWGGDRPKVAQI